MKRPGWLLLVGVLCGGVACGEGDDKDAAGGQSGAAGSGQSGAAGTGGAAGSGGAAGDGGAAGSAGAGDTLRDVSVAFSGFSADAGKTFYAVVANELGEPQFGARTVLQGGDVVFEWYQAIPPSSGEKYKLFYWSDTNDDGKCDAPPTDHVWSKDLGPGDDQTFYGGSVESDADWTDVCGKIMGFLEAAPPQLGGGVTGFEPHIGEGLRISVFDSGGSRFFTGQELKQGALEFIVYSYALQETGSVRFHIDSNQSSSCDDPPTDLVWKKPYALKDGLAVGLVYSESDASISTCDDPPK